METSHSIKTYLLIIGAINWGLIGFFGVNIIGTIFGSIFFFERLIYIVIGIAGIWAFFSLQKQRKNLHAKTYGQEKKFTTPFP